MSFLRAFDGNVEGCFFYKGVMYRQKTSKPITDNNKTTSESPFIPLNRIFIEHQLSKLDSPSFSISMREKSDL